MVRIRLTALILVGLVTGAGALTAQGADQSCSRPAYHQFDFFAGDWVATKTDGKPAGTNLVTVEEGGCMLLEHWKGAGGTNGQSLNFFDRNDQKWHQVWVDNEGNWLDLVGELEGKSMNFVTTTVGPGGKPQLIRAAFVDTLNHLVREHYESSSDNGGTWKAEFDAMFSPAKDKSLGKNGAGTACSAVPYRQFDFWVGNWNVTDPKGTAAGKNLITIEENGCLVHEHWTGSGPSVGQSFNFYDKNDKHWHQRWIDNGGNALDLTGDFTDGKMVLVGHNKQDSKPAVQRITWSQNADGSVRQLWDTSLDDGKTWTVAFDGTYRKQ